MSAHWEQFSKKLSARIDDPRHVGICTPDLAKERGMRLAVGEEGSVEEGRWLLVYLLVDEMDGVIADACFQAFGSPALIGAAESGCELVMRKNYDQAKRLSAELLDKQMRDKSDKPAFPLEASSDLNCVLAAIEYAAEQCLDIPLADAYIAPPMDLSSLEGKEYPGWKELTTVQKRAVIEEVIAREIRPYIELDAGGIQVLNLVDDKEVHIAYQGACTSCYSSTGATLNAIQQILSTQISPDLIVIPDGSTLFMH